MIFRTIVQFLSLFGYFSPIFASTQSHYDYLSRSGSLQQQNSQNPGSGGSSSSSASGAQYGIHDGKLYKLVPDERKTRQLSSLSATNLQAAGSAADYGYADGGVDFGNYAAAGHSQGYGHGGGGGHGHGGGGHGHKNNVNSSAVGLLGFLALLSLIQNVLRQMTTTAGMGRKRRDADDLDSDANKITRLMMPLLVRVGQARDGVIPPECTKHEVCIANRILVKELGAEGQSLGTMLSSAIGNMLGSPHRSTIEFAGRAGRQSDNETEKIDSCTTQFTPCSNLPPADIPQFVSILQSPLGKIY